MKTAAESAVQAMINEALRPLNDKIARHSERISSLEEEKDAALRRVKELERKVQELTPPSAELVFSWAKRWRVLMGLLGLTGPGLGLGSVLSKDALMASKMAFASISFLVLSATCFGATSAGNVRNISTQGEKVLVCLCG
eukprot:CAMPEP_0182461216 /NCGR_PEP_ID=MMETSP1319-20130603/5859_1 /TAXON_ID=172717 /ORGANISM="Bolidomonas pacifica, Strain RCC208" /LENGTH=139 /DNA_ID=CAMNT_0024660465 /DNA_START=54 /DNA_END=469 /DNA_ORIENTATION=-